MMQDYDIIIRTVIYVHVFASLSINVAGSPARIHNVFEDKYIL